MYVFSLLHPSPFPSLSQNQLKKFTRERYSWELLIEAPLCYPTLFWQVLSQVNTGWKMLYISNHKRLVGLSVELLSATIVIIRIYFHIKIKDAFCRLTRRFKNTYIVSYYILNVKRALNTNNLWT